MLTVLYGFSKVCLPFVVSRRVKCEVVVFWLARLKADHGIPKHIRSDNGPEFTAAKVGEWLGSLDVGTLYIKPGFPWENGYDESFHGKLRDESLNGASFYALHEAEEFIEDWRKHCNQKPPQSSLRYQPPAPEAWAANKPRLSPRLVGAVS